MSVSRLATQCDNLLTACLSDRRLNAETRLDLTNLLTRFRIWAGNVGAFAPGNASIDYRLRDDADVTNILLSMLSALRTDVDHVVNPRLLEEEEEEEEGNDHGSVLESPPCHQSAGSSSLELDLDSESDVERAVPSRGVVEDKELIRRANDIVGRLYRLTSAVRKPVSSSENARARQLIAERPDWIRDELDDVEDHARTHILARFTGTSTSLTERLVSAAILRRAKLCYRKRHQEKLRQTTIPIQAPAGDLAGAKPPIQDSPAGWASQSASRHVLGAVEARFGRGRMHHGGQSIALSGTNASSVNRQQVPNYAASTALSGITRSAVARRQQLDVPRPPDDWSGEQPSFECPYCFRLIPKEMQKGYAGRKCCR